jgi:hypothetical protein
MKKRGQFNDGFTSLYNPSTQGKSLFDLYRAIQADPTIAGFQKDLLIQQVASAAGGASGSTPIAVLLARGGGGVLGYLISKYFGMGPVGQVVSTLGGMSLGKGLLNMLNGSQSSGPQYMGSI